MCVYHSSKFAMKFATKRLFVLFLLLAVAAVASCRQTDLGAGGSKVSGSARATDLGVGGIVVGKVLGGATGGLGWGIANEGKVIASTFLDAHNKLVVQARALSFAQKS